MGSKPVGPPRIRDTLQTFARLHRRAATANATPSGTSSTVTQPGALSALTTAGHAVLYAGPLYDGTYGVVLARQDGTTMVTVSGFSGWSLYDAAGNALATDDDGGVGLSRPFLPLPVLDASSALEVATAASTYTTVSVIPHYRQQPNVVAFVWARTSDGTTAGNLQLYDVDNAVALGTPVAVPAGQNGILTLGPVAYPGAQLSVRQLAVQAQVTAGTGTIGCRTAAYSLGT